MAPSRLAVDTDAELIPSRSPHELLTFARLGVTDLLDRALADRA